MEVQPYPPFLMVIDHHENSHNNAYLDPKYHPPGMWVI
jgi:hypothetical protein